MLLDDILASLQGMSESDKVDLKRQFVVTKEVWFPSVGPQEDAFKSDADELFYGGSAGGGKTDLLVGLSLTRHTKSLMLRRTNKEASKMVERYIEIMGHKDGWNGQDHVWRFPDGKVIDIGGVQHEDDKQKYKGTPHDLIGWDEISDFTETQFRFINTWNRSASEGQRCRVVCAGNPPTRAEGLWVIKYWAPWLDETHPNPAKPGELRWFTTINGKDQEVEGRGPHLIAGDLVEAKSRTFIPARLADNPYLFRTNYAATLAALPEELRAAYRDGKFNANLRDNPMQVIPTAWIIEAQNRWTKDGGRGQQMTAMGFDPAGGGADAAELACRYGPWYEELFTSKGSETADGSHAAAALIMRRRDQAAIIVDVGGGYGGPVTMRLKDNQIPYVGFNGANTSSRRTRDGQLKFFNKRAEAWWRMREELDPDQSGGAVVALPPDPELRADLSAPTYEVGLRGIQIESKDSLRERLGRSPGKGDAVVMAMSEGDAAVRRGKGGVHSSWFIEKPKFATVSEAQRNRRR